MGNTQDKALKAGQVLFFRLPGGKISLAGFIQLNQKLFHSRIPASEGGWSRRQRGRPPKRSRQPAMNWLLPRRKEALYLERVGGSIYFGFLAISLKDRISRTIINLVILH